MRIPIRTIMQEQQPVQQFCYHQKRVVSITPVRLADGRVYWYDLMLADGTRISLWPETLLEREGSRT